LCIHVPHLKENDPARRRRSTEKKKCGGLKNPVGISHVTSASLLLLDERKKNAFHFFFVMPIEKSPFDFLGYVAHYNTWWNRGGTTKIDVQKMKSPFFLTFHQIGVVVVFFYFPRVYRHIFWVVRVVGALYSFAR
jgi:hypothetical protein